MDKILDSLLTPGEVASAFRVDRKTVTRWAKAGKLTWIRTPGGHRRFRAAEVRGFLSSNGLEISESLPRELAVQ